MISKVYGINIWSMLFLHGKGYRSAEESMSFWRGMEWKGEQIDIIGHLDPRVKVVAQVGNVYCVSYVVTTEFVF